jgi:antitoxin PrlF
MIVSRITSKAQTTIPQAVRKALALGPGDELAYQIDGDRVVISKASTETWFDPFACFDEWSSDADREGYANL